MHALPVNLPCVKQLPAITNEAGASPHAGNTCAIGVVTVRPFNRQPAQLYFKLTPDPNNTFFFIFTCTTQYPWVLANPDLSQAMASSKQKRTHTVFRASSTHRSASTSKPRFAGERVKLGDVCTIVSGATPKTKTNEYWGGEIRWVTPAELDGDSHYISDTEKHLTEAGYKSTSLRMMPKGTVLLTTRAPIGKVAIAAEEMSCNQGFKNLVCSSAINNEFLYLYLKSRTAELQAMGRGATFKELSKKNVAGFEINLPAIDRQLDAVAKLTAVRSQIALAKQQHDQLDSLVKSRFVEMFGDPVTAVSDITLGEVANMKAGKTTTAKTIHDVYAPGLSPCYGGNGLRGYSAEPTHEGIFPLIGRQGALCGNVQIAHGTFRATEHAVVVDCKISCEPVWLFHYLKYDDLGRLATGAAQPGLSLKDLKLVPVQLPPKDRQVEFISFASQVDKSRFVRDHEINFR